MNAAVNELSAYTDCQPPSTLSSRLTLVREPGSPYSENIRALRTDLLLRRGPPDHADFVAVLSPGGGEGRSFLAAELAIAFAQLGQTTLLVDADLRKPTQHLLFGADNRHGLADALAQNTAPVPQQVTGIPQLSLVVSGSLSRNPLELLSSGCFERIVDGWRSAYTFVVLDTSPVSSYSDALAVASLIGRVLLLSRAQHTRYRETHNLLQRLTATQSQIMGAVLNHF